MNKIPFLALQVANAISMIGNMFAMIAIPWFVLQTTGSPAQTGISGFFNTLASVIAAFLGGTIVDRLGFKPTSILADLFSGVTVILIPLLYTTVGLQYWQLLVLVFLGAFLDAPGVTAREAILPDVARMAGLNLDQASASLQAVERGSRLLGAPLAGLLIGLVGIQQVLWLDGISFAVSALLVLILIPSHVMHMERKEGRAGFMEDTRAGLRFILRDQLLLALILLVVIGNFLDTPMYAVIYPVFVQQFFGQALNLGILVSASGGGALVSAILYGIWGGRFPRRTIFFIGFSFMAVKYILYSFVPSFGLLVVFAFIAGLGAGPINPILMSIEYERIPASLRGRVLGTITALAYVAMPLGTLVAGFVLEWADVRAVLAVTGLIYLASVVTFMLLPVTRQINHRAVEEISAPCCE